VDNIKVDIKEIGFEWIEMGSGYSPVVDLFNITSGIFYPAEKLRSS
jgi:hypothetical protein